MKNTRETKMSKQQRQQQQKFFLYTYNNNNNNNIDSNSKAALDFILFNNSMPQPFRIVRWNELINI